jgi:superfamily II DNA or RNA helicase
MTSFEIVPFQFASETGEPVLDWSRKYSKEEALELATALFTSFFQESRINKETSELEFLVPDTSVWIKDFQLRASCSIFQKILRQHQGDLLISATGTGKTYMFCLVLWLLEKLEYFSAVTPQGSIPLFQVLVVTKVSVVEQTKRVLRDFGLTTAKSQLRIFVTNYDSLRASLGELLIEWKSEVKEGELEVNPFWKTSFSPLVVVWDECQALRNENSLQTKVARAYNYLHHVKRVFNLYDSATPFDRIANARCVVVGCGVEAFDIAGTKFRVSEVQWPGFASSICASGFTPTDYSPRSMENLREEMTDWITRTENIKFPFKSVNSHILIEFETKEQADEYAQAYEDYIAKLREIMNDPFYEQGRMAQIFVAMMKFRQKAEFLRHKILAKLAIEFEKSGKNVIIGFAFRNTLSATKNDLLALGINEKLISEIHGSQTREERQANLDAFQNESAHILLLMQQAGGIGLSAHHYFKNKRPRQVVLTPVWSVIEMLQVLGRAHRINSASPTHQSIAWYSETIEQEVMERLKMKHSSLSKLLERKEQFHDMFTPREIREKLEAIPQTQQQRQLKNGEDEADVLDVDAEVIAANTEEQE